LHNQDNQQHHADQNNVATDLINSIVGVDKEHWCQQ